jgi:hypothetical protein
MAHFIDEYLMLDPTFFFNFFQIVMLNIKELIPIDYPFKGSPYRAILGQLMIIG